MATALSVNDFRPRSELVTPAHSVPRARFRAIDAHNHLAPRSANQKIDYGRLVGIMDETNLQTIVNLSGGTGPGLAQNMAQMDHAYPGRFVNFCNVDWLNVGAPGWSDIAVNSLERDVDAGARGLKIFKRLGLEVRDTEGALVAPDDARLFDLWEKAGELGIPVLIHVADPRAFFRPLDGLNERWDELNAHPNWHFNGPEFPPFEQLIEQLYHLIELHPSTHFITAHVGCYPENLGFVTQMLDKYPNFYTDMSARIAELGRAPYSARKWFLKYADRILFGTDITPSVEMYCVHFRFLETADEYFDYDAGSEIPTQGRWKIYGLDLPGEVLAKVYAGNARRLLRLP